MMMTLNTHLNPSHSLVLIHGLYQSPIVMKVLGNRLKTLGYEVLYFKYPTIQREFSENVADFAHFLQKVKTPYTIIGHSLGCLITKEALDTTVAISNKIDSENQPSIPSSVIAITPPFKGSRIVGYLNDHHADFLVGKAVHALMPNPHSIHWEHPNIPLGVIAGTDHKGPSSLLLEKLTNTLQDDSILGDGTVYLDETEIDGKSDFYTLHQSHTKILFDPSLPDICDYFIKHGKFPKKTLITEA